MNKFFIKSLSGLYLLYCTVFSLIITVAGILVTRNSGGYFFQLLFLPVTIFFVLTLFSKVKRGKNHGSTQDASHAQRGKLFFAMVLVLFLALIMFALFRIAGG